MQYKRGLKLLKFNERNIILKQNDKNRERTKTKYKISYYNTKFKDQNCWTTTNKMAGLYPLKWKQAEILTPGFYNHYDIIIKLLLLLLLIRVLLLSVVT